MNGLVTLAGLAAGAYMLFKTKDGTGSTTTVDPSTVDPTTPGSSGVGVTITEDGAHVSIPLPGGGSLNFDTGTNGWFDSNGNSITSPKLSAAQQEAISAARWLKACSTPGTYWIEQYDVPNSSYHATAFIPSMPIQVASRVDLLRKMHLIRSFSIVLIVTNSSRTLLIVDKAIPDGQAITKEHGTTLGNVSIRVTYRKPSGGAFGL